jgi:hypothetical protein
MSCSWAFFADCRLQTADRQRQPFGILPFIKRVRPPGKRKWPFPVTFLIFIPMKMLRFSILSPRTFFLLFLVSVFTACDLFHFNTLNPYNDTVSDHLKKYSVKKIQIVVPSADSIYPGSTFSFGVIAETRSKKELKTRGSLNGFVNWSSYLVQVDGGYFENGMITVNPDPRRTDGHLKITVTPFEFPELKQELIVPISYKRKFIANCKGHNGVGGYNGLSGDDLKKLDTLHKHRASQPYDGQAGTDGERGADGCIADVFVKSITVSGKQLMDVLVINHCNNEHLVYRIDPDGGSLLVNVSGGDGGNGGRGGDGGRGIDGAGADYKVQPYPIVPLPDSLGDPKFYHYNGSYYYMDLQMDSTKDPSGNGGPGGIGGNGGNGGIGGNGGVTVIHLDSSAVQWKDKIVVDNSGGKAGIPGKGGWAGKGGRHAYGMMTKHDGDNGYIGAPGIKGKKGEPGSPAEYRVETVKMAW